MATKADLVPVAPQDVPGVDPLALAAAALNTLSDLAVNHSRMAVSQSRAHTSLKGPHVDVVRRAKRSAGSSQNSSDGELGIAEENGDEVPAAKKRKNASVSCVPCKAAHRACDCQRPCSRCVKMGIVSDCVDVQQKKRGPPPKADKRGRRQSKAAAPVSGKPVPDISSAVFDASCDMALDQLLTGAFASPSPSASPSTGTHSEGESLLSPSSLSSFGGALVPSPRSLSLSSSPGDIQSTQEGETSASDETSLVVGSPFFASTSVPLDSADLLDFAFKMPNGLLDAVLEELAMGAMGVNGSEAAMSPLDRAPLDYIAGAYDGFEGYVVSPPPRTASPFFPSVVTPDYEGFNFPVRVTGEAYTMHYPCGDGVLRAMPISTGTVYDYTALSEYDLLVHSRNDDSPAGVVPGLIGVGKWFLPYLNPKTREMLRTADTLQKLKNPDGTAPPKFADMMKAMLRKMTELWQEVEGLSFIEVGVRGFVSGCGQQPGHAMTVSRESLGDRIPYLVWNASARITYVSNSLCRLIDSTPEDVLAKTKFAYNIVSPKADVWRSSCMHIGAVMSRTVTNYESTFTMSHRQGFRIRFRLKVDCARDPFTGKYLYSIGYCIAC